jgi:hypothetical protein
MCGVSDICLPPHQVYSFFKWQNHKRRIQLKLRRG